MRESWQRIIDSVRAHEQRGERPTNAALLQAAGYETFAALRAQLSVMARAKLIRLVGSGATARVESVPQ